MANGKGIIIGALIGTAIGSLAVALYPRRKEIINALRDNAEVLREKSRDTAEFVMDQAFPERTEKGSPLVTGSLLGLLAGAGITALLSPNSGKVFRNQLSRAFTDFSDKTQDFMSTIQHNGFSKSKVHKLTKHLKKKTHSKKRVLKKH